MIGGLWLDLVTFRHGQPDIDKGDKVTRWTWRDADLGIRVTQRTHAWEIFAWTTQRSAMLRVQDQPTNFDMVSVINLVGLGTPSRKSRVMAELA